MRVAQILLLMVSVLLPSCNNGYGRTAEVVAFPSGDKILHGYLYKPDGPGPFPAMLYNHGSASGDLNTLAFDAIAPVFLAHGWAFFAPYRRGQGLSADVGPYIMDEIRAAQASTGAEEAAETLVRLLTTDHLNDQLAALTWLKRQPFVRSDVIAAMGNSFGGIETILGARNGGYCAAVDAAGGAESWDDAPALRDIMTRAAREVLQPVLFFQAANDVTTVPSRELFAARRAVGRPAEIKIYPAFGDSSRDGHAFPYRGVDVWRSDIVRFLDQNCGTMEDGFASGSARYQ
ncbi:alpha/beta hydrolase family protein [Neorhizobium galegae]|uniref:alpha/beta hydrolase family protein n=1 Tax=Neorhizobium galegae TaxID=399 RepID=UPI0006214F3F|nr:dienelactone hydrolase family protein [Neorhizobium galegae]CDZ51720.1 Putative dienelactone hydrolase and related enzymes signal peptide protein [Neorhizobium galegae bv. orientalis]